MITIPIISREQAIARNTATRRRITTQLREMPPGRSRPGATVTSLIRIAGRHR